MLLDFNTMPFEDLPHFKDGEGSFHVQMYFDGTTRIMHGILVPGSSIGLHRHEGNCEILFVLSGDGTLLEDSERKPITAGQCTYCPDGHEHSLINTGTADLEFYAAVPKQ